MDKKQEFLKRILATFRIEAEENINRMSADLIELEKEPPDLRKKELIEVVFRAAHSLKGAARAVNFSEIEKLCHSFEDVMSVIRNNIIEFSPQIFDLLHQNVDLLNEVLNNKEEGLSPELNSKISAQIEKLSMVEAGLEIGISETVEIKESIPETKTNPQVVEQVIEKTAEVIKSSSGNNHTNETKLKNNIYTKKSSGETIRISTSKLDKLLFQAEEMLTLKLSTIQRTKNLQAILNKLIIWDKESSEVFSSIQDIKQSLAKKEKKRTFSNEEEEMSKIIQFYEWANSHINNIEKELNDLRDFSHQEAYSAGSKIETLLDDVKELITVPFSTLLDVFPKMIRDIAKDLGKEVNFIVEGDDIKIDRRILEKIHDPLIHLLRNSVDYGIEKPDERIKKNKSKKGKITLKIERFENNKVELVIIDDGAGINLKKLKQLYIEDESIAEKDIEKISEKEYLNIIFKSGISTGDIVTDLSGRGLGLAIVQEAIDQLGGTIDVETEPEKSTTFRIRLPLSIVTFRGVILGLSGKEFIVPTSKVQSVLRLNKKEIKTIENKATIPLNGEIIPLINLSEILELPLNGNASDYIQIIVFEIKTKKMAFAIDKVIGEQEVLVKNFNRQLSRVRNIAGASILGSGKAVPILNIPDLFKSSVKITTSIAAFSDTKESDTEKQKSILIVEDSITSRTLLKNILEASGYHITTAIDGVEGFTKLKEGNFDAVVTDIEMPKMNGFDLTAKIRADKESANMPVVLVTSLSKREDRERGIDVGANAYIIKSSFDQSNLLEILERLI
jgi:two-component system, chemotaxis family, sensor kinase CheA